MIRRRAFSAAMLAMPFLGRRSNAKQTLVWKTEAELVVESKPEECLPDDEECQSSHHVSYVSRSQYGRRYYLTYEEASRAYISFDAGLLDNRDVQFVFALEQLAPGAFDWGGIMEGGKFKPLYVIKRFYDPYFDYGTDQVDTSKSGLYVWKLSDPLGKGRSETIGMAGAENANARELAEKDFALQQKEK
jgi:hypothetical protein